MGQSDAKLGRIAVIYSIVTFQERLANDEIESKIARIGEFINSQIIIQRGIRPWDPICKCFWPNLCIRDEIILATGLRWQSRDDCLSVTDDRLQGDLAYDRET